MAMAVAPVKLTWNRPRPPQVYVTQDVSPPPSTAVRPRVRVLLPLRPYAACVIGLAVLHGLCAAYLLGLGWLHAFLDDPFMSYYANLLATTEDLYFWGGVFSAIGGIHIVQIIVALASLSINLWRGRPIRSTVSDRSRQNRLVRRSLTALDDIFGSQGLLGIEGRYFGEMFLLRETVETVSQFFLAHRFSTLITRPWINHAYVVTVVANCWGAIFVQHWFRHDLVLERVACIVGDLVLNVIVCMVIPAIIALPYLKVFDLAVFAFPNEVLYNDVSFTSMIMENRSLFVVTMFDGMSKVIPHLSILMALHAVRGLLRPLYHRRPKKNPTTQPQGNGLVLKSAVRERGRSVMTERHFNSTLRRVIRFLLIVAGIVVIVLHVRAAEIEKRSIDDGGCKLKLRPWFPQKTACSLYEYNCHRLNKSSPEAEMSMSHLDPNILLAFIISHCPALVMPRSIRDLPALISFEIWNSSIVAWDRDAAIDETTHPQLIYLGIIHSNMTELPMGIRHSLPPLLLDIEISVSNLTHLPEDLHEYWPVMTLLFIEHTQIREFPSTLLEMSITELSLVGNQSNHAHEQQHPPRYQDMLSLSLSGNPLRQLPEEVSESMSTAFLAVEDTPVTTLPPWTMGHVKNEVYGSGSPLCNTDLGSRTSLRVNCEPQGTSVGRYALGLMEKLRIV